MTEKTMQEIIKAQKSRFVTRIKSYADDKGYEIGYIFVKVYDDGFESLFFEILTKEFNSYTPKIYYKNSMQKFDNCPEFEVQTACYGALNQGEMNDFITAMTDGFNLQDFLHNCIDWSECPRIKFEYE